MKSDESAKQWFNRRRIRWAVRNLFRFAVLIVLLQQMRSWDTAYVAYLVSAASPFVALASMVSAGGFGLMVLSGLFVTAITLVHRRWFCHWMCPTGLLADMATRVGRQCGRSCPKVTPFGQWIVLLTLFGALLGYPMFLWLDPLALLSSSLAIFAGVSGAALWLSAVGILLLLLLSVAWPGVWCQRICPLGATQDLLARGSQVVRREGVAFVTRVDRSTPVDNRPGMSRRFVLGAVVGVGWAAAARVVIGKKTHCIRPPGALEEARFVGLCVRCGNCVRACPTDILKPDILQHGVASLMTPVVEFDRDYCREDCVRCTTVCPSGALWHLALGDKVNARIGLARVAPDICLLTEDRECSACRNSCPFEAITYLWSDVEYMLTVKIDPSQCPGCGACEVACPTTPTKAIVVVPS